MGNFIADFFCKKLMLVIEVDGLSHQSGESEISDIQMDIEIGKMGYQIIRFNDSDVSMTCRMFQGHCSFGFEEKRGGER